MIFSDKKIGRGVKAELQRFYFYYFKQLKINKLDYQI